MATWPVGLLQRARRFLLEELWREDFGAQRITRALVRGLQLSALIVRGFIDDRLSRWGPDTSAAKPMEEPAKDPTKEPAKDPTKDPAKDPKKDPIKDPAKNPAKDPGKGSG